MDYVCIDQLLGDRLTARTVAVYFDGRFEDNLDYALEDTPCGVVVGKTVCTFPDGVRHLFPRDTALQEMTAEGYVGTTLWSSQGQPIGLIAMISRKPLRNLKRAESLLQLISIRAAGELERMFAEEELKQSRDQVTQILESISDAFFTLDKDWRFTYVNKEAQHILKASREQLIGANIWEQFPEAFGSVFQSEYERAIQDRVTVQFDTYYCPFNQWLEVRAYPYPDGLSVYFRDCSLRRMAQESQEQVSERNAHIADMLQQIILPPEIPIQPIGYEIAARYNPALSEAEVCGDFYDLIDLRDGKLGIVIGDVVGKGLSAAARVAAVRHTMRSYAFMDDRPSNIMSLVNNALVRDIATESDMLTAFFAVLDTRNDSLIYTNAGHEPPMIRHLDGSVEYLTEGGLMFIGMGKQQYSEESLNLSAGDIFVMVTDGITEARKENTIEQFGADGVVSCLCVNFEASADQIADRLVESAVSFVDGILRDDAAVVVIKKT
jgi:PAS domain S-box-containing protein